MVSLIFVPGDRCRYPAQEAFFTIPNQPDDNSIEPKIAAFLWRWSTADAAGRNSIATSPDLGSLLEYWFPFSDIEFTRKRNIWCDGILLVEITELNFRSFCIAGVGYFPQVLELFEIEFHFENQRDPVPRSCVLRFGLPDGQGELQPLGHKHPGYIIGLRPKTNSEWAVAVELTDDSSGNAR